MRFYPLFDAPVNYGVGNTPRSVAVADFDGGTGDDLAVVNYQSDISILLNNGDGTYAAAVDYLVGTIPTSIFAADLDGVNGPDLAVTNANGHDVSILLNNGNGTFAAAVNYGVGSYPYSVFSADLDGDGDYDLAAANNGHSAYGNVSILLNNGNGTFAAAVNYLAGDGPVSVFLADLDGDHDKDLAVANLDDDNVSVLLNDGYGTFATAVNYPVGAGPYCVFSADLDGDNDNDLAVANPGTDDVSVLLNDGNGTFAAAANYLAGDAPFSVFSADLDGDHYNDLSVANFESDDVSILINLSPDAVGTLFDAPVNYGTGDYPRSVALANLDGDNDCDLAVVNYFSDNVSILLNNGDGIFAPEVNYSVGSYPTSIFAADLDGVNGPDLAVTNANGDDISVLLNNGDGTFAAAVDYGIGSYPYSVFSADLDGDGDYDLAAANNAHGAYGNVSILLNNGNGTFAAAVNYLAADGPVSVFLGDLDGDNDKDLAVANGDSDDVSILLNDGYGSFGTATNYGVGTGPYSIFSADLDGDNDNDLAVANPGTDDVSVLLNDGNGIFTAAVNYGVGAFPQSLVSADFDGDNVFDLAVANRGDDDVSILKNFGDGTFAVAVDFDAGDGAFWIAAADLDGDQNNDLAVANFDSDDVSILINLSLDRVVVINEILYHQGQGGGRLTQLNHEWVELYNSSESAVDLTGWIISDQGGLSDISLPSWSLPAGCFLTVHLTDGTNDSDFGDLDGHYYTGSAFELFDNDQDECALYAGAPQASTIVDFVSWSDDSNPAAYTPGTSHDYAVSAGIWTTGEYFDSQGLGKADCLTRFYDGLDRNIPGDWRIVPKIIYIHNGPLQPENPIQESPHNRRIIDDNTPTFEWAYFADADSCQLQVDNNWDFSSPEIEVSALTGTDYTPSSPLADDPYFWRLRAYVNESPTKWAAEWLFMVQTTAPAPSETAGPQHACPFKWQRKDTRLLCLWDQKNSTRPGCPETGDHAWNKPHPDEPPACPHDSVYCARASIAMVNNAYGGDLSQDRISYHIGKDYRAEPEGDLGHGVGFTDGEVTTALSWALDEATIDYQLVAEGGFTFTQMKDWVDRFHCFVAGVPRHCLVVKDYAELTCAETSGHIQAVGTHDPALGANYQSIFAYIIEGTPARYWRRHRNNTFDAVWLQPESGVTALMQEASVTDDTDGDGIRDFDEGLPRALDCMWTEEDTDSDEVWDKEEILNYTFHDMYCPGHDNDALDFPDIDGDGMRAEGDCDSDNDSEFDGGEDINGDGHNSVSPPTETCQFKDSEYEMVVSVNKDVYNIEEMVFITDNPAPTRTFHANREYHYEMGIGEPSKVDGDPIAWSGSFWTGPDGHAILTPVGVCQEFGEHYLYVDVLSDNLYSAPDNLDPVTGFVCQPAYQWISIGIDDSAPALPGQLVDIGVTVKFSGMWEWMAKNIGIDFLIGYDAAALAFMEATPGQLLEDCGWEYFTYRYGADGNCGDACPSGLLRIMAVADMDDGPNHPACTGPTDSETHQLTEMSFMVSANPVYQGTMLPLSFFWGTCTDNIITNITSDIMHVDQAIYGHDNNLIWDEEDDILFPEGARLPFVGAPDECLIPGEEEPLPERGLYFFSGGIDLRCDPAEQCCFRVGNANGLGGDEPTIGDISVMIDAKFISGTCDGIIASLAEADVNHSGGTEPTCDDITIGDMSILIDYLFITGPELGLLECL